jgi:hypothetical protein
MAKKETIPASQTIDQIKLKKWVKSYTASIKGEKNETKSCLINLNVLYDFLKQIDKYNKGKTTRIDAIRIYFARCNDGTNYLKLSDGVTSQTTVAIVPAQGFKIHSTHKVEAKDCFDEPLTWIVPGYSNETSGLCPPNCSGTIGKGG